MGAVAGLALWQAHNIVMNTFIINRRKTGGVGGVNYVNVPLHATDARTEARSTVQINHIRQLCQAASGQIIN